MRSNTPATVQPAAPLLGIGYALLAYLAWGLMPVYWKRVAEIPALQMVAHRVVWSVLVLVLLLTLLKRWPAVVETAASRPRLALLSATATLITVNWLTFVWAVQNAYVLEASLGYFINPLFNIVLGMAFLGERLRPGQWVAVLIAGLGVLNLIVQLGTVPWVALTLALSFGLYGLLRKIAPVDGLVGLSVETFLLTPVALAYLLYSDFTGAGAFLRVDWRLDLWVAQAGWVTALPLLWFANAAKRLRYATLGFFQYLAPTCHFLLAVGLYGENLTGAHLVTFSCIWSALVIYSVDTSRGLA
jgi:chloramphenicol-sensitive protein RarD